MKKYLLGLNLISVDLSSYTLTTDVYVDESKEENNKY